jgi:Lipoprotein LpqB beta-propeller domain
MVDARATTTADQMAVTSNDEVAVRLGLIGRTEDVAISPDGSRLAVAGYGTNAIAIVGFEIARRRQGGHVTLTDVRMIGAEGLARPHGITFLDDQTLLVANRESELVLVELTSTRDRGTCSARVIIDGNSRVPVRTPGSVAVRRIAGGLVDVVVCNNYAHDVTRYVLDGSARSSVSSAGPKQRPCG